MKLRQKLAVALMATAFAGGANAAIDNSLSGNGSLFLSVWNGVDTSATFDLGYNMDSFLPAAMSAAGTNVSWNLIGSSVSNNAGLGATVLNYASAWNSFAATVSNWANVVFDIAAMDQIGTAAGQDRYLSTSKDAESIVKNQGTSNLLNFAQVDTYVNTNNALGTNFTDANGASVATAANNNGYYPTGKAAKWLNKATFTSNNTVGSSIPFYLLASGASGLAKATVTPFGYSDLPDANGNGKTFEYGAFSLSQGGVLTYSVAAVPEADTWAMFAAGLLAVGAIARRRLQA